MTAQIQQRICMIVLEVTAMLSDISLRGEFCLVAGYLLAVIRVELDVALQQRELGCVRPLEVVERSAW